MLENKFLPADGLVETPPTMAAAIINGSRSMLVKSKTQMNIDPGEYVLLSMRKALGVVRLGEREEITTEARLEELAVEHLVSKAVRDEWSESQPSWAAPPWYAWPVEVVKRFNEPCETDASVTPQYVIKGVSVLTPDEWAGEPIEKAIWSSPAGKTKLANRLVALFPEHDTYVEPFIGSGAVLFEKEPSGEEVINDLDPEIIGAFKSIKNLNTAGINKLRGMLWKGDKANYAKVYKSSPTDEVSKLYRFLYMAHCSYGKQRGSSFNPGAQGVSFGLLEKVEAAVPRLAKVKMFNTTYSDVVKKFDSKNTLFFLDPPYVGYNGGVGESKFDEQEFMDLLKSLKGKFLITYGIRGEFPKLVKDTDFIVKRVRTIRSMRNMKGAGSGKYLTQLLVSNYDQAAKSNDENVIIDDWTEDMLAESIEAERIEKAKKFMLTANADPEEMTTAEMLAAHWKLHNLYPELLSGKLKGKWTTEDIVNLHAKIVDALYEEDEDHPAPPDNGLDDLSESFEDHSDEQETTWTTPPVEKRLDAEGDRICQKELKRVKAVDPYLVAPDEGKKCRFVVQHHFRGKSMHADVRIESEPNGLLFGWTLNTQIPGAIKESVLTVADAKKVATKDTLDDVSKINWVTGDWATRPKAGTDKLVRAEILSERKALEPHAWLDVEGKTKDPEPGKPPPVGGTPEFPGVFCIMDQGAVEYGAQKDWLHEYFFHGAGLNYRVFFRQLTIKKSIGGECEECGGGTDLGLAWGDGAPASFCKSCGLVWLEKAGVVLPASEGQPIKDGAMWLAIRPDDARPYALGEEAVAKAWMPEDGVSALPKAVRDKMPAEYRYWSKSGDAARAMRDALVDAIKSGDVTIDFEYGGKREKASLQKACFVLQEQTWSAANPARIENRNPRWMLRIDAGMPKLLVAELDLNPLDVKKSVARVGYDAHISSMDLSGKIAPGHYLNPSMSAASYVSELDAGSATVQELSDDVLKVVLTGNSINGLYEAKRDGAKWIWQASEQASPVDTAKRDENVFDLYFPFEYVRIEKKAGDEKRLVTGIVLEPHVVDAQKDFEPPEVIEKAAHEFLANYNKPAADGGTKMGLMHKSFEAIGVELVESSIAHADYFLGGTSKSKKVKKGSWVVTVHISSDKTWEDVKEGRLTGFSVGGTVITPGNDGKRRASR